MTGTAHWPEHSRLADAVGPCYTTEAIARLFNQPIKTIEAQVGDGRLLALTTADGFIVLPAFQVHDGGVAQGLPDVLLALREGVDDPWTWALWLNSTPPAVEGITPEVSRIQQLIDGEFDRVLRAAERSASSWRS